MKNIESLLGKIEKDFGKGSLIRLGSDFKINVEVIKTGSVSLDLATGIGGYPKGRIIEIFGPESSGKTTMALHAIAECQREQGVAMFIDAEHALDPKYAKAIGVDTENLLVAQPDCGEDALNMVEEAIKTGEVDIIVIDSVAALVPKDEIEGEMGDRHLGTQARLMSQALRKLVSVVSKTNTCLIFINQIRMKIGVMYGSPEVTTGGNALKFYSSIRLEVRRKAYIKDKQEVVLGNETKVKVVKNKLAAPFKEVTLDIVYGQGIDKEGDILDLAIEKGIIQKAGAWLKYKDENLANGREKAKELLKNDNLIFEELKKEIERVL